MSETRPSETRIEPARPDDAPAIAVLHASRIREGFLPSLGTDFLTVLYEAMSASSNAELLVARTETERLSGFVGGSADPAGFASWFRRRYGVRAALKILPRIWKPSVLRGIRETRNHVAREGAGIGPELFSIAVALSATRTGVGSALVGGLEAALRQRGASFLGVVVDESNSPARDFYERSGFRAANELQVHRGVRSIRYEKSI